MASDRRQQNCLADLCDSIDYGFTTSAKDDPVGPKFLRITDIVGDGINWSTVPFCEIDPGKKSNYRLHSGDIVIARTGATTGYSAYLSDVPDAVFASYLVRLRIRRPHSARFIAYYLKGSQFWNYMHGVLGDKSAQPNASATTLTQAPIDIPPPEVQQRIAEVLGKLDDKIELNRQMNRTLGNMAAAIFKSWFIDFDPVHAKAKGRAPNLPAEISDLFPDSFEDSALGPIPKGWKLKPIGDTVRCVGGATPSTKNPEFWEGGRHPFVTPRDMSSLQSPVILDSERHITDAGVEKISSKQLPVGAVILSSRAPIGYLGVATVPVSVNQGVIAMICDRDLPNLYVLHWTASTMDLIKSRAGGTTFAEISKQNFRPIPVLVPATPVRNAFMANVTPLHERITLNVRQNRGLAGLRNNLLPRFLNGEIELECKHA